MADMLYILVHVHNKTTVCTCVSKTNKNPTGPANVVAKKASNQRLFVSPSTSLQNKGVNIRFHLMPRIHMK